MRDLLKTLLVLSFIVSSNICFAIDPNSPSELQVYIAVSDSPSHIEEWLRKSFEQPIMINRVTTFEPNETAYIAFLATGFDFSREGKCDLAVDVEIILPNGEIFFSKKEYAKAISPASGKSMFVLLDPALDLKFDIADSLGSYKVKATLKDRTNDKMSFREEKIELVSASQKVRDLLNCPITEAETLDNLWEYYFKERNPVAVHRIISVMHWGKDGTGMQILLGAAARWSLESNAYKHPDVYKICKEQLELADHATKKILEEIISKVDKEKIKEADY